MHVGADFVYSKRKRRRNTDWFHTDYERYLNSLKTIILSCYQYNGRDLIDNIGSIPSLDQCYRRPNNCSAEIGHISEATCKCLTGGFNQATYNAENLNAEEKLPNPVVQKNSPLGQLNTYHKSGRRIFGHRCRTDENEKRETIVKWVAGKLLQITLELHTFKQKTLTNRQKCQHEFGSSLSEVESSSKQTYKVHLTVGTAR